MRDFERRHVPASSFPLLASHSRASPTNETSYCRGEGYPLVSGSRRKGWALVETVARYVTIRLIRYVMKSRMPLAESHDISHALEVKLDLGSRARARFRQEAEDSWQAFRTTGLHLTGGEVYAWLDTWGTDTEKAVPGCHN